MVNQINLYDYSSIQNCVCECHFHVLGGKLPTNLLNVTRLPLSKRSPTPLLLVEEKYQVANTKSFVRAFNHFHTTRYHSLRYNASPNINYSNSE